MKVDSELALNIDSRYSHFRHVARSLWNCGFNQSDEFRALSYKLAYQRIVEMLFQIYVFGPTKVWSPQDNPTSFPLPLDDPRRILVVPNSQYVAISISDSGPGLGQNYGEPRAIGGDRLLLRFLEPFDWDVLGMRDFLYVCVLIEYWVENPGAVGKVALLEIHQVSLWLEDRANLDQCWQGTRGDEND